MRAIVYTQYGTPDVLRMAEVETPTPGPGQLLVRVHAATISSTDATARRGARFIERTAFGLTQPKQHVLGTAFSGVVEAVGDGVTRFKAGDEVFGASGMNFGAHAEYVCADEDSALMLKPSALSHQEAASISESGLTALPFLRDLGRVGPGMKVLILGASGAIGTLAVQLARHMGAEVTAVCSAANAALATSLGASDVIDYQSEDFTDRAATWDVIFDTVGASTFWRARRALKAGGLYMTAYLNASIVFAAPLSKLTRHRAAIAFTGLRKPAEQRPDLALLASLASDGVIKPVVDSTWTLEQAVSAHQRVDTGRKRGNAVLVMAAA